MRVYYDGGIYEVYTSTGIFNLLLYVQRGVTAHLATLLVGTYDKGGR